MPKYELEETSHAEIDSDFDAGLEDSSHPEIESNEEDASQEVSSEDEGAPEEQEEGKEIVEEEESQDPLEDEEELIPEMQMPDPGAFELGNGLALKAGDKITPQHIHELQRGFQREAVFTQKCQEVAQVREQANGVIQTFNQVVANEHTQPALLFNHVTPEHAIRALAAIGLDVDPNLLKEIGYGSSYRNQGGQNPQGQNQQFAPIDPQIQRGLEEFGKWTKQNNTKQLIDSIDTEVNSYVQDIKDDQLKHLLRRNILVGIAANPNKEIRDIAMDERRFLKERFSKTISAKKGQRVPIGRKSGSSRPVGAKAPDSWEAAERSARGRMGLR